MKKKIKYLLIGILALILTGCSSSKVITDIDYSKLEEMIDNKESFILEVVQTGCSHCEEFSPRFKAVLKTNDEVAYSLNLYNMTDDELKRFERKEIEPVYNAETGKIENVEKRYVDWGAAAGEILQSGKVPPDELASRGFIRSGREGVRPMKEIQGWGYERQGLRGQVFERPSWSLSAPVGESSSSPSKSGWSLNN